MSLSDIKGIGPKRAEAFARLGIEDSSQLLNYFPFRYEDRRNILKIADIKVMIGHHPGQGHRGQA